MAIARPSANIIDTDTDGVSSADLARQNATHIRTSDARARRTLDQLRKGFLSLVEVKSLESIIIDDLISTAGVSRSTFYRHFATKEAFVDHIAENEIEDLASCVFPLMSTSNSFASCMALVIYVDERRKLWTTLLNGGAADVMRSRFIKLATRVGASQVGGDDRDLPTDLGAAFGVAATVEVLSWWLRQPVAVPLERVAELIERLAVRPTLYMAGA